MGSSAEPHNPFPKCWVSVSILGSARTHMHTRTHTCAHTSTHMHICTHPGGPTLCSMCEPLCPCSPSRPTDRRSSSGHVQMLRPLWASLWHGRERSSPSKLLRVTPSAFQFTFMNSGRETNAGGPEARALCSTGPVRSQGSVGGHQDGEALHLTVHTSQLSAVMAPRR